MKRLHLVLVLGLALAAGPAWAAEDISKVNGRISAEADRSYGDLDTVNGGIDVGERAQTGKVETVNGSIRIGAQARTGGLSTVNGEITLAERAVVDGGIETVNGGVLVERGGQIRGGVETVNGGIGLVGTQLGQGIETVNGDITVGVGSHVAGGIEVKKPSFSLSFKPSRKPRVIIGPDAVVEGALNFERDVTLYVHRTARIGNVSGATPRSFDSEVAPKE